MNSNNGGRGGAEEVNFKISYPYGVPVSTGELVDQGNLVSFDVDLSKVKPTNRFNIMNLFKNRTH